MSSGKIKTCCQWSNTAFLACPHPLKRPSGAQRLLRDCLPWSARQVRQANRPPAKTQDSSTSRIRRPCRRTLSREAGNSGGLQDPGWDKPDHRSLKGFAGLRSHPGLAVGRSPLVRVESPEGVTEIRAMSCSKTVRGGKGLSPLRSRSA